MTIVPIAGALTLDVDVSGSPRIVTRVRMGSWSAEETQALTLDIELSGTLSIDVTPVDPPEGLDTEGPDIQHFDFPDDLVLDSNGRPV